METLMTRKKEVDLRHKLCRLKIKKLTVTGCYLTSRDKKESTDVGAL